MWFPNPKRKLQQVALEIIEGLRSGTIVPDPEFVRDPGEALPKTSEDSVSLGQAFISLCRAVPQPQPIETVGIGQGAMDGARPNQ